MTQDFAVYSKTTHLSISLSIKEDDANHVDKFTNLSIPLFVNVDVYLLCPCFLLLLDDTVGVRDLVQLWTSTCARHRQDVDPHIQYGCGKFRGPALYSKYMV